MEAAPSAAKTRVKLGVRGVETRTASSDAIAERAASQDTQPTTKRRNPGGLRPCDREEEPQPA
jgi:hypothetical protein